MKESGVFMVGKAESGMCHEIKSSSMQYTIKYTMQTLKKHAKLIIACDMGDYKRGVITKGIEGSQSRNNTEFKVPMTL